jgi:hypothetical protein
MDKQKARINRRLQLYDSINNSFFVPPEMEKSWKENTDRILEPCYCSEGSHLVVEFKEDKRLNRFFGYSC